MSSAVATLASLTAGGGGPSMMGYGCPCKQCSSLTQNFTMTRQAGLFHKSHMYRAYGEARMATLASLTAGSGGPSVMGYGCPCKQCSSLTQTFVIKR